MNQPSLRDCGNMVSEISLHNEVSSCLDDILNAVKWSNLQDCPCTPEVLACEYATGTKYKNVEKETFDTWNGPCTTELYCEKCGESHDDIIIRGPTELGWRLDYLSVFIPDISTEHLNSGRRPKECYATVMCGSCVLDKERMDEVYDGFGERCSTCGISNILCCDEDVLEDHFHYKTYSDLGLCGFCPSCSENLSESEKRVNTISRRENLSIPHGQDWLDLSDSEDVDLSDSEDVDLSDSEEYENEELPENNTEKANKIKGAIRKVGEKIFDLQDVMKEGDYLEIMNLLQEATNAVNYL